MSKNRCPLFAKLKKPRLVKFFVKINCLITLKLYAFLKMVLLLGDLSVLKLKRILEGVSIPGDLPVLKIFRKTPHFFLKKWFQCRVTCPF
jgi:hypothetical protein